MKGRIRSTDISDVKSDGALSPDIVIVNADPNWPRDFQRLRAGLAAGLGSTAISIEHVGSTSVAGLAAKPIIDLDVVVAARDSEILKAIDRLRELGYAYEGDLGIPGRAAFRQPPDLPRHHLYVFREDHPEPGRHCAFRDALSADVSLAEAYATLKRDLAGRFPADRERYTAAKSAFIETVLGQFVAAQRQNL